MATNKVLFYSLTSSQYAGLTTKDTNALYYLSDSGEVFKGATRYSYPVKYVATSELPAIANAELGVLYVEHTTAGTYNLKIKATAAATDYTTLVSNDLSNFVTSVAASNTTSAGQFTYYKGGSSFTANTKGAFTGIATVSNGGIVVSSTDGAGSIGTSTAYISGAVTAVTSAANGGIVVSKTDGAGSTESSTVYVSGAVNSLSTIASNGGIVLTKTDGAGSTVVESAFISGAVMGVSTIASNGGIVISSTDGSGNVGSSTVYVKGAVTSVGYNSTTGALTITATNGAGSTEVVGSVNLPLEQFLTGATTHTMSSEDSGETWYDAQAIGHIGLLLTVTNTATSTTSQYWVDLQNFVDVYTLDETSGHTNDAVKINVTDVTTGGTITGWTVDATVNYTTFISGISDGAIPQSKITNLTTDLAGKLSNAFLTGANNNAVITTNADHSDVSVSNKVLGSDSDTAFTADNTLATEKAVAAYVDAHEVVWQTIS